ncbi:type III secretion protein HrpB1 [Paraburkholderia sp. UCT70]|uniref:HrpB1 family type III secretion system apparatus protein n=1 Tax=Paraburkholderia sp. UCT70 TaxID=2991068 RepID=UPI003D1DE7BB
MSDTECRDDVAGGLTKVLWTASQLDDESDFDDLLEAIRVLRPRWSGVGTVMAWRYVRRRAWIDARRVLEDDVPEARRSGLHAALMAVCLFGLEDPLWHGYARSAAEQQENPDAAGIGNRLLEQAARLEGRNAPRVEPRAPAASSAPGTHDGGGFAAPMSWMRA